MAIMSANLTNSSSDSLSRLSAGPIPPSAMESFHSIVPNAATAGSTACSNAAISILSGPAAPTAPLPPSISVSKAAPSAGQSSLERSFLQHPIYEKNLWKIVTEYSFDSLTLLLAFEGNEDGSILSKINPYDLGELLVNAVLTKAETTATKIYAIRIVEKIIACSRFGDINASHLSWTLRKAAENGHPAVVKALIACRRFGDFDVRSLGEALEKAAEKGRLAVVNALITCPRFFEIFPESLDAALEKAAEKGHLAVVNALIACPRFFEIFPESLTAALEKAAEKGHLAVVNALS